MGNTSKLSEKVIEQYEARLAEKDGEIERFLQQLEEKDETIAFLRKGAR